MDIIVSARHMDLTEAMKAASSQALKVLITLKISIKRKSF